MRVKELRLLNYRNYSRLTLNFNAGLTVFIGENAQGKTNIVESIYYAALGRSHRTNSDQDLTLWRAGEARIQIVFERLSVENRIDIYFKSERPKEILYNSYPIKSKELIGRMNAVLFSPEDLSLIKGAPSGRRDFLDVELSQANPSYFRKLSTYCRVVAQRNTLLKKIRERKAVPELLDQWDAQLADMAAFIVQKRLEAIKKLDMLANLMHRRITANKENLDIQYQLSGCDAGIPKDLISWYNYKLKESRQTDIMRGVTSVGPHRDDMTLMINRVNLRSFGSQGQQRTGVLALKLAELEFMKSETGEYPILLLDDVMSELDANRREQLLLFIKDRIQTFITAADINYFPKGIAGKFYRISNGEAAEDNYGAID